LITAAVMSEVDESCALEKIRQEALVAASELQKRAEKKSKAKELREKQQAAEAATNPAALLSAPLSLLSAPLNALRPPPPVALRKIKMPKKGVDDGDMYDVL
jgi:hypothetical protein